MEHKRYLHHGMEGTHIYHSWESMIQRCNNQNSQSYKYYGGKGIAVCKRWYIFANFYEDMGDRPEGMTLDRIDNKMDYYLENCRWSTYKNQARNRNNNRIIIYKNQQYCIAELAEIYGLTHSTLTTRIRQNWDMEDALTIPPGMVTNYVKYKRNQLL